MRAGVPSIWWNLSSCYGFDIWNFDRRKISDNPALPDDVSWSARLFETRLSHPSSNRRSKIRAPTSPLM